MKRRLFAAVASLALLSGCATLLNTQNCERALAGLQTAQQIVAVLEARGVAPEIAAKVANALTLGAITLAAACASVPPAPVSTPGG